MDRYEVKAWQLKILTGSSHYPLFERISENLSKDHPNCIVPLSATKFSNDNIKVKIEDCVRGQDVFIIQPNYPDQNERLIELLIIIDALKHASAGRITAVLPYFPYSRSDKKDEARISITARLVADMLETAGDHRVITTMGEKAHGFNRGMKANKK
jgi:ribose-phosphate pyrophosphokinase